jgi:ADP-ribose pyrophosphatase
MTTKRDPLEWELLGKRPGSCGWIRVTTAHFKMPDGSEADWDLVEGGDIVAVLAVTTEDEIILVRQYRPGPGLVLREIPGGLVDEGETPLAAAIRELREETGYEGEATIIGSCWRSASQDRRQWIAVVTRCREVSEPEPGALEFLEVELVGVDGFREHMRTGQLTDTGAAYRGLDQLGWL